MYRSADITLYAPCYRAEATIGSCLAAVRKQTIAPGRVFLVDDGSQPPLPAAGIEIVRHPSNRGLAAARNTALAACHTPLLAALDADVVPEPEWLERLLAAVQSGDMAGAGGRLDEQFQEALADRWRAVHMAQHWGDAPQTDPRFLYGANTLFRADRLRQAGAYDAVYRTNNEDRTLCDRLYAQGRHLCYVPSARARHLRRDTARTILRGYWQWHHAKGVARGDFDSTAGLIRRIGEVNFGIFRFRYAMDQRAGRSDFLGVDAAIPWLFCLYDMQLYAGRAGEPAPDFLRPLCPVPTLSKLWPAAPEPDPVPPWWQAYRVEFQKCLDRSGWMQECAGDHEYWRQLERELNLCDT